MHSSISLIVLALIAATNVVAAPQLRPVFVPRAGKGGANAGGNGTAAGAATGASCPAMIIVFARGTTEVSSIYSTHEFQKLSVSSSIYFHYITLLIITHPILNGDNFQTGALGTIVGPPLQTSLDAQMGAGAAKVMGVPAPAYAADIPGFLAGGSASGSKAMAQMAQQQMQACPNSAITLSGYRFVFPAPFK